MVKAAAVFEQEHVKQVAKWTQFIADQHAQGPDGYMTAIENAKAVWHKTHPGLRFGAPVPYRCVCVFVCVCLCACVCVCGGGVGGGGVGAMYDPAHLFVA